jgi:hypothetical protein
MSDYTPSTQELWARLRFSIVGRLLSGPPSEGELEGALRELAARQWNHPTQPGKTTSFSSPCSCARVRRTKRLTGHGQRTDVG